MSTLKNSLDSFVKEYTESRNKKETNVIYMTSRCNFDCEYCFENDSRKSMKKPIDITRKEIDEFLDDIEWRETGLNSTIVFFGGEPLLMFDDIEYTVNSMKNRDKKGGWGWEITTNGYLLKNDDIFNRVNNLLNMDDANFRGSIKLSFDVSGQFKRKILSSNKNSYDDILEVLHKLDNLNKKFKISYTISDGNVDNFKEDLVWLLTNTKNVSEIIVNVARSHIEKEIWTNPDDYDNFMLKLEKFCSALFFKFKTPLCELVCDACGRCNKVETQNNYLVPERNEEIKDYKLTCETFNKFSDVYEK